MSATTEPKGFRRDIMVLHAVSELMEKHPALARPEVTLAPRYQVNEKVHIRWYMHPDYGLDPDKKWDVYAEEYEAYNERRKDVRRLDIERRIAATVDALEALAGEPIEWEKNDPTQDEYYYRLTAVWQGARVEITTGRDDICQKIVVLETEREEEVPDPELHETFLKAVPKVKVTVKDTITEWQCNSALAERTAPVHIRKVSVQ